MDDLIFDRLEYSLLGLNIAPDFKLGEISLEAMQVYSVQYQRQGLRNDTQVTRPRIFDYEDFELPRSSIYHYISQQPDEVGPPLNESLLTQIKKLIYMYHVKDLKQQTGPVIKTNLQVETLLQTYHARNRRFKRSLSRIAGLKDSLAPLVINYPLILKHYKYQENPKAKYNKWLDYYTTIISEARSAIEEVGTNHHQFMTFHLPTSIPPLSVIRQYVNTESLTSNLFSTFTGLEMLFFIDMYMWLGPTEQRQKSILGQFNDKELDALNIVLNDNGHTVLINLGKLNSFRRKPGETRGIEPTMLQLMFIKMYLNIMRYRGKSILEIEEDQETIVDVVVEDKPEREKVVEKVISRTGDTILEDEDDDDEEKTVAANRDDDFDNLEKQLDSSFSNPPTPTPDKEEDLEGEDDEVEEKKPIDEVDLKSQKAFETSIEKELELLDKVAKKERDKIIVPTKENTLPMYDQTVDFKELDYVEPIQNALEEMIADGVVTAGGAKRMITLANRYKEIMAPGTATPLSEYIAVSVKDTDIKDNITKPIAPDTLLVDKEMACSTIDTFTGKYIKEILPRDIAAMCVSIQNAGVAVTDFQMEEINHIEGDMYHYSMRVQPIEGPATNIKFKIPKFDEEGVFRVSNARYIYRAQKNDIPIRKVSNVRVALTSYYGKVFIERSEKRVNNYIKWLCNNVRSASLDKGQTNIVETRTGNVYDNEIKVPYLYSGLSQEFRSISTKDGLTFYFDYHKRFAKLGEASHYERAVGMTLCGRDKEGKWLFMDKNHIVYRLPQGIKTLSTAALLTIMNENKVGHLTTCLGLESNKAPLETASVLMQGKEIPLGFILAYDLGINQLIRRLGVPYRMVSNIKDDGSKQRLTLNHDEYAIKFLDQTLIFNRNDRLATLILSGFKTYGDTVKDYPMELFNKKDVYYNVLEANKLQAKYIREINLQYQMFIDPITYKVLEHLKLPTTYRSLLFKAAELLTTNDHPDEVDASYQRIRGYERMAGAVYTEIVKALRVHKARGFGSNYGVDVNPNAVLMSILQDPSKETVKELNPIGRMKEKEGVTYSGNGGRSGDTMVKRTRAFHDKDMGVISEAGVDSGKVGINFYMTANPRFVNLYGLSDPVDPNDKETLKPTNLLSTTSLLNVGSMNDDSKRVVFGGIMRTHIVPTYGNQILPLRTGYEQVIAHRVGKSFVHTAKEDCVITEITDKAITVKYENGKEEKIKIGRTYGDSGGLTIPHDMITTLKVNHKLKKGEIIAYNPIFFAPDPLDNSVLSMKDGVIARVALLESNYTLEDSNAVSRNFTKKMAMQITKKVPVFVSFDNEIHNIVKTGQNVTIDDLLCIIEDPITANNSMFDEESIMALQALGAMTPKAKKNGVVERIEVYYNGDKDDMSDSLRKIADESDRRFLKETKVDGSKGYTGSVTGNFRFDAKPVEPDKALILFYITGEEAFGGGDKCVFGNQMKSTVGNVMEESPETESGLEIDAVFGIRSIYARIVLSPMIMGTTISLLKGIGKHIANKYLKD